MPTRQGIEDGIKWLLSDVQPGDTLLFYYSGHGTNVADKTGDESDRQDEALCPLDFEQTGFMLDDWLLQNLTGKVPEGVNLWGFSDSCRSGTVFDLNYNYKSVCQYKVPPMTTTSKTDMGNPYHDEEWTDEFEQYTELSKKVGGNVCFFSGCLDYEYSSDATNPETGSPQGAFTFCFLKFLDNHIDECGYGPVPLNKMLKELNCLLDIYGYNSQQSLLSMSNVSFIECNFML